MDGIRFVATSATRDAENREEFEDNIEKILGVRPEVIPGTEEADLSFLGATSIVHREVEAPIWWSIWAEVPPNWCWEATASPIRARRCRPRSP